MSAKGRNKEVVRRIKRASQAKYAEGLFMSGTPRAEEVARALLNVLRNQRALFVNTEEGKRLVAQLLNAATESLVRDGFSKAQVLRKIGKILKSPKPMTVAEAEEHARRLADMKRVPEARKTTSISEAMRWADRRE